MDCRLPLRSTIEFGTLFGNVILVWRGRLAYMQILEFYTWTVNRTPSSQLFSRHCPVHYLVDNRVACYKVAPIKWHEHFCLNETSVHSCELLCCLIRLNYLKKKFWFRIFDAILSLKSFWDFTILCWLIGRLNLLSPLSTVSRTRWDTTQYSPTDKPPWQHLKSVATELVECEVFHLFAFYISEYVHIVRSSNAEITSGPEVQVAK